MFDRVKKYLVFIIIGLVFCMGLFYLFRNDDVSDDIDNNIFLENNEVEVLDDYILVDIKGSVNAPGVYSLKEGSRIMDLISMAGGVREEADISILNLSLLLHDEDVVIIYSKSEIKELKSGSTSIKIVEKECVCPQINSVGCIDKAITNNETGNSNKESSSSSNSKVSLNHATKEELETLPGIGPSKAQAIIDYRDSNGGFKVLEDIKKVKGIGDATYEKLKEHITV